MKEKDKNKPFFSVVIPTFNAEKFIARAVDSLLNQTCDDFEIIVVDDKSTDSTAEKLEKFASSDDRLKFFIQQKNSGTLASRAKGVSEAGGKYVTLIDQDDELKPEALEKLKDALKKDPVDIIHFGVEVVPESQDAKQAATDCENWLTPKPMSLKGTEILNMQFLDVDNFDWHVHHKVFEASLAKKAWGTFANERLCTSDDFLLSYILCSFAKSYLALPNSKWYFYHLGAGETFGDDYGIEKWKRICHVDAKALALIKEFERGNKFDHDEVVKSCQHKLVEHIMNEMHDNLGGTDVDECIDCALESFDSESVAGELWRFVRDRAYEDIVMKRNGKKDPTLSTLVKQARYADSFVRKFDDERYCQMKEIAERHLSELRGESFKDKVLDFYKKRIGK